MQEQLAPELQAQVADAGDLAGDSGLDLLVWQCPGERDAEGFLRWLSSLSPGEIYERVASYGTGGGPEALPGDLGAWRDRCVHLLTGWHEQYFRHADPAIFAALAADAEARRAQLGRMDPLDVMERATGGVR